jgi:hypothetical protein
LSALPVMDRLGAARRWFQRESPRSKQAFLYHYPTVIKKGLTPIHLRKPLLFLVGDTGIEPVTSTV